MVNIRLVNMGKDFGRVGRSFTDFLMQILMNKATLAPVQELLRVLHSSGVDRVIPLGTDGMASELNGFQLDIADSLAG
jgi:hypothetical protein